MLYNALIKYKIVYFIYNYKKLGYITYVYKHILILELNLYFFIQLYNIFVILYNLDIMIFKMYIFNLTLINLNINVYSNVY